MANPRLIPTANLTWLPLELRYVLPPAAVNGQQDSETGCEAAPHGTGDFRLAELASSVADRHLGNLQTQARGLGLHLDVPAKVRITQVEAAKGVCAEHPQRSEIAVGHSPDPPHQPGCHPVAETLQRSEGSRLRIAEDPRAHDKVPIAVSKNRHQLREVARVVGKVAVHESHGSRPRTNLGEASEARLPIATARLLDNLRSGRACCLGSRVLAAIVHHDDLGKEPAREVAENLPDRLSFVESGDNEGVIVLAPWSLVRGRHRFWSAHDRFTQLEHPCRRLTRSPQIL